MALSSAESDNLAAEESQVSGRRCQSRFGRPEFEFRVAVLSQPLARTTWLVLLIPCLAAALQRVCQAQEVAAKDLGADDDWFRPEADAGSLRRILGDAPHRDRGRSSAQYRLAFGEDPAVIFETSVDKQVGRCTLDDSEQGDRDQGR